jgi:hypothetical protein
MPLHWRIDDVKNFDEFCYEERVPLPSEGGGDKPVSMLRSGTKQLIFATMVVGMCLISKKNFKEFWFRLHLYESLFGTFRLEEDGDQLFYLLPDVQDHIGLVTNATTVPFAKWSKQVKETYLERIKE